jgi:hypothetical protein
MPHTEIAEVVIFWAVVTFLGVAAMHKCRGERTTFYGGCTFLVLGMVTPLLLTAFLGQHLGCSLPTCESARVQATALISLFTISWAAVGASLLAAFLSHK